MLDIDRMLEKCGDFHRYQFLLMGLFGVVNVLSSMHYYSQTIISFVPEHWCYAEELKNLTIDEVRLRYTDYKDPHCTPYNASGYQPHDVIEMKNDGLSEEGIFMRLQSIKDEYSVENNTTCSQWIYNYDYGYKSMTADLNWVCDSAWKSTLGQSLFFIGSVVGTLAFGVLADKIGRLPVLILAFMMAFIGNGSSIFTKDIATFSVTRFISGMATDSNFVMMYILIMEYIRPSMRTFGLNLMIGIFYCIGSMVTPWVAVLAGNWQSFLFFSIMPVVVMPFFYFIIPESAQWLIAKNKIDKSIKCFKTVAKFNGKILDKETIDDFTKNIRTQLKSHDENPNLLGLFKTPRLRRNTLILFFKSMVITLCYDAISKNVEGLGLSPFVMFSLSAIAIFPACLVLLFFQDRIGRKAMASSSLFISGVFTAGTGIAIAYQKDSQDPVLLASLAIIGRFGVTVAYNSGAQYATELIPTCVRAQGVAAVHVAGYAFTFFSSYILYTATYFKPIPSLILGALSLAGAILCLFLPETLNRTIPCTLQDGENFGLGEKLFDFSCFEKPKSESTLGLHEK